MSITLEERILEEIEKEWAKGSRRVNAVEIAERVSENETHEGAISYALSVCETLESSGKLISYLRIPAYMNGKTPHLWQHHYRIVN